MTDDPAAGQPRHALLPVAAMVTQEPHVEGWEAAYRQYEQVSALATTSPVDEGATEWLMLLASWEVAVTWREIAAAMALPQWLAVAVEAAAQVFESQSDEWEAEMIKKAGDDGAGNHRAG